MAKTVRKTVPKIGRWGALFCGSALAFGGLLAMGCQPPVPASPSFEADVGPIFVAHCVRCHGAGPDGGTINTATQPTGPDAAGLASETVSGYTRSTTPVYFSQYYDSPNRFGAHSEAKSGGGKLLSGRIHGGGAPASPQMPPAPAPALNDWELKVVDAWIANPICSNSPKPDPTICPPDAGQ